MIYYFLQSIKKLFTLCNVVLLGFASGYTVIMAPSLIFTSVFVKDAASSGTRKLPRSSKR